MVYYNTVRICKFLALDLQVDRKRVKLSNGKDKVLELNLYNQI